MTGDGALEAQRVRAARNQSIFREVNERVVELSDRLAAPPRFVCECQSTQCADTIEATKEEYETVRSDPAAFLIAIGHNVPEVEETLAINDRFMVVRKLGAGHSLAARYDPRKAPA